MIKKSLIALITLYQRGISPLFPPSCRFYPSCSAYAIEAISVHGAWKGLRLAGKRFCRCHPFHRDKTMTVDPVPPKISGDKDNTVGNKRE